MTSITWAGPRCVQELATFLGPQNRTQGRCVGLIIYVTLALFTLLKQKLFHKSCQSYNLEQLEMIKPSKPNKLIVGGAASSLLAVVALQ